MEILPKTHLGLFVILGLMKIISWNVNGLRAVVRKGAFDFLIKESPDIFCLQETKATRDQLPDGVASPEGYHSFFTWPTNGKKGYSGVAVYSKIKPEKVEYHMSTKSDDEGRVVALYFKNLALINVYFPNGGGGPDRLKYKLEFYDYFLNFIQKLRKGGRSVIFCGDINTAHEEIDLARPKENEENTGFLPEERAWIDEVISAGFVDVWREKNPNKKDKYTYWDMKTSARDRNVGWRIDYFFVSQNLMPKVKDARILDSVLGSDHCPIELDVEFG